MNFVVSYFLFLLSVGVPLVKSTELSAARLWQQQHVALHLYIEQFFTFLSTPLNQIIVLLTCTWWHSLLDRVVQAQITVLTSMSTHQRSWFCQIRRPSRWHVEEQGRLLYIQPLHWPWSASQSMMYRVLSFRMEGTMAGRLSLSCPLWLRRPGTLWWQLIFTWTSG